MDLQAVRVCAIVPHMRKTPLQLLVQERTGRVLEELLRELYVDKGRTDSEIAQAIGVTRAVVQQWRSQMGIKRPPLEPLVDVA